MRIKQSQSSPILTVREIAKRILRDHEDLEVVVNRIRSWTTAGLLKPFGTENPGTGRSRFYEASVLIDARVLTALSDAGVTLANIEKFKSGDGDSILGLARWSACDVADAEARGTIYYLVIFGRAPATARSQKGLEYSPATARSQNGPAYVAYVCHAKDVPNFDPSKPADDQPVRLSREHVLVPIDAHWSVVLNLTEILRPLRGVVTAVNEHGFVKVAFIENTEKK